MSYSEYMSKVLPVVGSTLYSDYYHTYRTPDMNCQLHVVEFRC